MSGCITLRVTFTNGDCSEYPIHQPDGDWRYSDLQEGPPRLCVRPWGKGGNSRHEVPLCNVQSIMVVGLNPAPEEEPF